MLKHGQKVLIREYLEDQTWTGGHSLDMRKLGMASNPSGRLSEMAAAGLAMRQRHEQLDGYPKGEGWGIRVWLERFAPRDSTPIVPDPGDELGDAAPAPVERPVVAELAVRRRDVAMAYHYEYGEQIRLLPWATVCALTGVAEAVEVSESEAKAILEAETLTALSRGGGGADPFEVAAA